jgi:hypothetical protein
MYFAIKPSPGESDMVVFEHALKQVFPMGSDTYIRTTLADPTPELYPFKRNFDNNVGVYINFPDSCEECIHYYNDIETRFDYFSVERIMNDGGVNRLQDLVVLGVDAYSGDVEPVSRHAITASDDHDSYVLYRVRDNTTSWEYGWLWALFVIVFIAVIIWAAWDVPVYTRCRS